MFILGVLLSIAGIFLGVAALYSYKFEEESWPLTIVVISSMALGGLILSSFQDESLPTALDVYRGKTTLEITYRDSVAVDSVVVYKMK